MENKNYDIVVVGGGIHGVGTAQAAAANGYSTLLLEKETLASATSSRSSKLIHGGLRYLESGNLHLVYECLRERHLLLVNAPSLVKMIPFNIPIYKSTSRPPFIIRIGLTLYFALAGFRMEAIFRSVPKSEWSGLDGLTTDDLKAVFRYGDAQTDDRLLTESIMRSAQKLGADLATQAEFIGAEYGSEGWAVSYKQNGKSNNVRASVIINCAGPWINDVLRRVTPRQKEASVEFVAGTHILLDGKLDKGVYFVEAPQDKRAVLIMPWQDKILIGTTETVFKGDPAKIEPLEEEKEYLLKTLAKYFPKFKGATKADIIESFAGIRVLPTGEDDPFHRSRETFFHHGNLKEAPMLTICGGKLTSYRATSEKIIRAVSPLLPSRMRIADTRRLRLE
ncbi:MAG: FAD-dependent oxidoreductase [Nitrospinota bacterium]|nr:FAD-dependent oxidoreductase [Nitrospinota bacterium]